MSEKPTETRLERYERLVAEERARLKAEEERKAAKIRDRDLKEFEILTGDKEVQGSVANGQKQLQRWQERISGRAARAQELSEQHGFELPESVSDVILVILAGTHENPDIEWIPDERTIQAPDYSFT
ncbi:hypothetical protein ACFVAJ_17330 [Agromyces sp. NPDC057679]|uniref:hypothetical protein n=1 Tax=Agromyces sp. NPDC057679 TaxID=3346207 RepID=UPI00366F7B5B